MRKEKASTWGLCMAYTTFLERSSSNLDRELISLACFIYFPCSQFSLCNFVVQLNPSILNGVAIKKKLINLVNNIKYVYNLYGF